MIEDEMVGWHHSVDGIELDGRLNDNTILIESQFSQFFNHFPYVLIHCLKSSC